MLKSFVPEILHKFRLNVSSKLFGEKLKAQYADLAAVP